MIHNELSPSHYTDLPFEAESGSIHSAQNHIFQDFFQKILLVNYIVNPSWAHKMKSSEESQGIHDLEQIEGSVFAHSSDIVRGWKFITYHINPEIITLSNVYSKTIMLHR